MRDTNTIDLRTAGGIRFVTVTPGNSVQYIVDAQQARIGQSGSGAGLYNYIRAYVIQGDLTVVRATGGTDIIFPDRFPMAIKSIGLTTPLFGTQIDPSVVNGLIAKELIEYPALGYNRSGINRQPIPGADGTYTRTFELELPYAQMWNDDPDHFDHWLGWLDQAVLELFVNDAANPFALAGGGSGVSITSVQFSVSLKMVPWPEIIIPPFVNFRRYLQGASSGSSGPKLIGVGDAGALQGVDDAARLDGMFFSHQSAGFVGSGTADQVSGISMPWRDQAQSLLPAHFFERYLGSARMPRLGWSTATIAEVNDLTAPYPMATSFTGPLNNNQARYTPLVWREKLGSQISYLQKVKGNYPLDGMTFSAGQTNNFVVFTRELKQYSTTKCSELLAAMGIDPSKVQLVPKLSKKNVKPIDPSKTFCLPRSVVAKAA